MARGGGWWLCRKPEGGRERFESAQGGAWLVAETGGRYEARWVWV